MTRKKYVKRGKFGSRVRTTESTKQLAVYQNPFSVATQQPKIPDGQRNFTLGTSFRSQISVTTTTGNVMIALFPGVQTFGAIWNTLANDTVPTGNPNQLLMRPQASGGLDAAVNDKIKFETKELEGWRCVSAGLKVKCINNSLSNDGMFQAIRLRQCNWSETLRALTGHYPRLTWPPISEWSNDPTYVSGELKRINKHSFQLAVENNDHPFIAWDEDGMMQLPDGFPYIYDTSYDIVLVHIKGSVETKLMLDGFFNNEQTFRAGTQLNYYQTQTLQIAPAQLAAIQNRMKYKTRKA